jgi:hypothetical protein
MKILDRTEARIEKIGNRTGIFLPLEYEGLAGFSARFDGAVEDGKLVLLIRPEIDGAVRETVDELWRDLRLLFSDLADIGPQPPWQDMDIVWEAENAPESKVYSGKVPIVAAEVLEHRRIYNTKPLYGDLKDIRRGIFDTMGKLCVLASRHLGFKSQLFIIAFGEAMASMFCQVGCYFSAADVICNVFSEEFSSIYPDRYWSLTSERSREAIDACYRKIKYLEDHPEAFEKEKERVMNLWGAMPPHP